MTLLRRVLLEKRLAITAVLVALILDVGLYALAVLPWSVALSNAKQRAAAAHAALTAAEKRLLLARSTVAGKLDADRELQSFYSEMLPSDMSDARGITFARLEATAAQNNLVMERRSTTTEREQGTRLARLEMTMFLKGDYRDMRTFISELEAGDDFIVIEEISLSQDSASENTEALTLGLATYFWTEGDQD